VGRLFLSTAPLLMALATSGVAQAQASRQKHDAQPAANRAAEKDTADASHAVHEAMSGEMIANRHLRLTPLRTPTAADSATADAIVREARVGLAKYKDVRVAEREGYRMFAPNLKDQSVYHFTKLGAAIRERFRFDPTKPTSLLYKRNADGTLRLIGAMYTAPTDATPEELNARVPLGIARWHLHTNMCIPRRSERERWTEVENGLPVFGPASPIATREGCDAVDGRFLPVVFNWMVHANVFEDDVWGHSH
jgi:hypothetical protein